MQSTQKTSQASIDWLLTETGLDDHEYRVTSTMVCEDVPLTAPTKCRLLMTLMPRGTFEALMYMRQASQDVTICPEHTMFDAFAALLEREGEYVCPIGLSWYPLN